MRIGKSLNSFLEKSWLNANPDAIPSAPGFCRGVRDLWTLSGTASSGSCYSGFKPEALICCLGTLLERSSEAFRVVLLSRLHARYAGVELVTDVRGE